MDVREESLEKLRHNCHGMDAFDACAIHGHVYVVSVWFAVTSMMHFLMSFYYLIYISWRTMFLLLDLYIMCIPCSYVVHCYIFRKNKNNMREQQYR